MLHPSMTELLTKVDNRYLLVNITAKRAREIADVAELHEIKLTEKPVKLALDDIMSGRIIPIETPLRPDQDANEVPEEPEQ